MGRYGDDDDDDDNKAEKGPMKLFGTLLSEGSRRCLLHFTVLLTFTAMAVSAAMVGVFAYYNMMFSPYMNLAGKMVVRDVLMILPVKGVFGAVIYGICIIGWTKTYNLYNRIKVFTTWLRSLTVLIIVWSIISLAFFGIVFMLFQNDQKVLKAGIMTSMKDYRFGNKTKQLIDKFQSSYECCGDKDYTDWFTIAWVDQKYLDPASDHIIKHTVGGSYIDENVPWSCCMKKTMRPCVTDRVRDKKSHYNEEKDLTLYKIGCGQKLTEMYKQLFGTMVFPVLAVELICLTSIVLLLRFLETSILQTLLEGDPNGAGIGYLFILSKPTTKLLPAAKKKKDDNASDNAAYGRRRRGQQKGSYESSSSSSSSSSSPSSSDSSTATEPYEDLADAEIIYIKEDKPKSMNRKIRQGEKRPCRKSKNMNNIGRNVALSSGNKLRRKEDNQLNSQASSMKKQSLKGKSNYIPRKSLAAFEEMGQYDLDPTVMYNYAEPVTTDSGNQYAMINVEPEEAYEPYENV